MVRCSCGAATCACVITAVPEDGIEVSGRGSQANPYRIKNIRNDALARLQVIDTDSVDLTFTNLQPGDPNGSYSLQADATVSMADLTDVDGNDIPASGDVPTWNGTQWVFQPVAPVGPTLPPGGTDGQVLTKQSSTNGDALWETPPLPLPPGGADGQVLTKQSSTSQDAAWEDVPTAVFTPVVTELLANVDLDTVTATGFYTQSHNAEATVALHYPIALAGQLEVTRNNLNTMTWQRYTVYAAGTTSGGVTWTRGKYDVSPWQPWVALGWVSGAWGTSPLNLFGADSLRGDPVYRDSAGQLRARGTAMAHEQLSASALANAYPFGVSTMDFDNTYGAANGWIGSGHVLTVRRNYDSTAFQLHSVYNANQLRYRQSGASFSWGEWIDIVGPGQNKKVAAGRATIAVANALSGATTVSFPAGLFSSPPRVSVVSIGSSIAYWYTGASPTATGVQIGVRHLDGVNLNATYSCDWIATEE